MTIDAVLKDREIDHSLENGTLTIDDWYLEDCLAVFKALEDDMTVDHLIMTGINLGEDGCQSLGRMLRVNTTLKTLSLPYCQLDEGGAALGEALEKNTSLKTLKLHANMIDEETMLFKALEGNKTLETFEFWYNTLTDITCLCSMLKVNKTLKHFKLRSCTSEEDGEAICKALSHTALETLNLEFCKIGDAGAVALGEMLKKNRTLKRLNLRRNKISKVGGVAIGQSLKVNTTLEFLNLSHNKLGDVHTIGEALEVNTMLKTLNLCDNQITEVNSMHKTCLRHLDLSLNELRDVRHLGEVLAKNNTIKLLDLRHNDIEDVTPIVEALKTNTSLLKIGLTTDQPVDEIEKCLDRNWTMPWCRHVISVTNALGQPDTTVRDYLKNCNPDTIRHIFHENQGRSAKRRKLDGDSARIVFNYL